MSKIYLKKVTSKGRLYFYNTGTGENYGHDPAIAQARFAEWKAAQMPGRPMGGPTLDDAIQSYYKSDWYLKEIKPRTRDLYHGYAEQLRQSAMGRLALDAIDSDVCKALQDSLKDQPSKCYQTLAVLQAVISHAIAERKMKGPNPVSGIKRVRSASRTAIWRQEQIDAFLAVARPSLRLAALLLFYTAQRPSDVLALTKGHVIELNGQLCIRTRQEKTGELVDVPVHPELEAALRERLADTSNGLMLVPSPTGLQWTRRNFSRAWDATRRKAKLPPLQRRDMRRTAVVSMAVAGCSVPYIGSVTGHSPKSIEDMLKIYLPRRTEVAVAAIEKWAAAPRQSLDATLDNVVQLARPVTKKTRARR